MHAHEHVCEVAERSQDCTLRCSEELTEYDAVESSHRQVVATASLFPELRLRSLNVASDDLEQLAHIATDDFDQHTRAAIDKSAFPQRNPKLWGVMHRLPKTRYFTARCACCRITRLFSDKDEPSAPLCAHNASIHERACNTLPFAAYACASLYSIKRRSKNLHTIKASMKHYFRNSTPVSKIFGNAGLMIARIHAAFARIETIGTHKTLEYVSFDSFIEYLVATARQPCHLRNTRLLLEHVFGGEGALIYTKRNHTNAHIEGSRTHASRLLDLILQLETPEVLRAELSSVQLDRRLLVALRSHPDYAESISREFEWFAADCRESMCKTLRASIVRYEKRKRRE